MFCYQCEQTLHGTGCTDKGVCGKDATTAALQDLLTYATKGISVYAHRARAHGGIDPDIDRFVVNALFTVVTNVNFHHVRMQNLVYEAAETMACARSLYENSARRAGAAIEELDGPTRFQPKADFDALVLQGLVVGIGDRKRRLGDDVTGLQELLAYGIRGTAAYVHHAAVLGYEDAGVYGDIHALMSFLADEPDSVPELLSACLRCGELNYRAMELLDRANTGTFGHPEPTAVRIEPVTGKAIVVSGHDLLDLKALLEQTEGTGINVYTHGEMLPAHGYPALRAHKHLVGNYGGAWQNQAPEFGKFPGAVLMTTNCIQRPTDRYIERIFTSGMVAWPGVRHISNRDFTPVIEAALAAPGFDHDGHDRHTMTGFAHNAVLSVAGQVVDAVKRGDIRHFFLIGGCDGARPGRNYYTELARAVPDDCVVLTLACGKFRFNKLPFGTVAGLPRLMDVGQCNDAYSAIQVALALAGAFECGVNDLPLSLVLSWYEQKAVAILLTLLHLGVRNIRLGPSLPAFVTPAALQVLVDTYGLKPIGTPQEDLADMLGATA